MDIPSLSAHIPAAANAKRETTSEARVLFAGCSFLPDSEGVIVGNRGSLRVP